MCCRLDRARLVATVERPLKGGLAAERLPTLRSERGCRGRQG
jgi:hypothetical protein